MASKPKMSNAQQQAADRAATQAREAKLQAQRQAASKSSNKSSKEYDDYREGQTLAERNAELAGSGRYVVASGPGWERSGSIAVRDAESGGGGGGAGGGLGGLLGGGLGGSKGTTDPAQRDAAEFIKRTFALYGLESLAAKIDEYVKQDYSADTIALMLKDTPEYKQRFKANEERRKRGIRELSPAEILGMEAEYEALFRAYGLPPGMFDNTDDFVKYIGGDVSVSEMQDRLNLARQSVMSDDPMVRENYKAWYAAGLTEGDALAAVLDPDRALPALERKARSIAFSVASQRQNVGISQARAEELSDMGVNPDRAQEGFGQVASIQRAAPGMAQRWGMEYEGQRDAEDATFMDSEAATNRIRKLGQRETAAFAGRGIGDSRSLGGRTY